MADQGITTPAAQEAGTDKIHLADNTALSSNGSAKESHLVSPAEGARGSLCLPGIEPAQEPKTSKIEEAIQEIVCAQMKLAGLNTEPAVVLTDKPSKWDVVFLVLGVIDLVLLIWFIPPEFFKDERIAFLKELIPWVFGSLFVLATTWYHDLTLTISQNKYFRICDVALAVVLIAIWCPLLSFRPVVEPADAQIRVDAEEEARDGSEPLRVNIRSHTIRLERHEDALENKRSFKVEVWDMFLATLGRKDLRWSLLYPARITSNWTGTKIKVSRQGTPFDADFLSDAKNFEPHHLSRLDEHTVRFGMPGDVKIATAMLPVGSYTMAPETAGCHMKEGTLEITPTDKFAFTAELICK